MNPTIRITKQPPKIIKVLPGTFKGKDPLGAIVKFTTFGRCNVSLQSLKNNVWRDVKQDMANGVPLIKSTPLDRDLCKQNSALVLKPGSYRFKVFSSFAEPIYTDRIEVKETDEICPRTFKPLPKTIY